MFAHMLPIQVTAKWPGYGPLPATPCGSVVIRLARLRAKASSLIAGGPPQRSISQLDCQPPRFDFCVLGWDFWRCSITPRNSTLSVIASGTSKTTSGVANKGTISGRILIRMRQATAPSSERAAQSAHRRADASPVQEAVWRGSERSRDRAVRRFPDIEKGPQQRRAL